MGERERGGGVEKAKFNLCSVAVATLGPLCHEEIATQLRNKI